MAVRPGRSPLPLMRQPEPKLVGNVPSRVPVLPSSLAGGDIQAIAEHFDAAIRSVHADHRAPIPPPLQPTEN